MRPFLIDRFYNPSSPYIAGREVRSALQAARGTIASVLGAKPAEIILTAGATESINLAISGIMQKHPTGHVVTTAIEHPAVLRTTEQYDYSVCEVATTGLLSVASLEACVTDDTVLTSVGYANNELGTVQPLKDIARMVAGIRQERLQKGNKTPLYLHSDASQAAGYLDINTSRLGVDMLTLNAAKCYGPKQTGLLWVKPGVELLPLIFGGGQESGYRSGTESVANVIGFAAALELAEAARKDESYRISQLRNRLHKLVTDALPHTVVNGHKKRHLPNILHLAWDNIDGERLIYALDSAGVMVATGSACAANKGTRSHVLEAVQMPDSLADGSLRISLGKQTTDEDIDKAAAAIIMAVQRETR